jgi:hypothetical protein
VYGKENNRRQRRSESSIENRQDQEQLDPDQTGENNQPQQISHNSDVRSCSGAAAELLSERSSEISRCRVTAGRDASEDVYQLPSAAPAWNFRFGLPGGPAQPRPAITANHDRLAV